MIAANLGQDELRYQLGSYPHYHFDNNEIARSLAYVDAEQARIGELATAANAGGAVSEDTAAAQRAAFGRLTHAVHDFYAHSNYVDLWLDANGGLDKSNPAEINGLDPILLAHPQLHTGSFLIWFDSFYYLPGFRPILRKLYLRPRSHEAMNLDNPAQGPKFAYAMVAAKQRTLYEYQRAIDTLRAAGSEAAVDRFHHG
jgi:hypothetical protein